MAEADDLGYLALLAQSLGASESALRLLLSLLAGMMNYFITADPYVCHMKVIRGGRNQMASRT